MDTHAELEAAWRSLIERQLPPNELVELGQVPVTETEASQLAANGWKDPAVRNLKKIQWQSWAQAKYQRLQQIGAGGARKITQGHALAN